jgi:hypothetical protein
METAMEQVLPKILGQTPFEIIRFQCKNELLVRLPDRLRAYRNWLPPTWRLVVVVDRDDDDCGQLKDQLERIVAAAGLVTRTAAKGGAYAVVNRVAVEELEAWYFGDWEAVRAAYPSVSPTVPVKAQYRNPDDIKGGTWEAFERIMRQAGYFRGGLRKIEAARRIAGHMQPERNTSPSFRALTSALMEMRQ